MSEEDAHETLEQRVRRVTAEPVDIVAYDSSWPSRFEEEKRRLLGCLPADLVVRIDHFGSTAVPGLAAKPVIDIMVGVTDLAAARERIPPILESQGYEYFWRPSFGDDGPPWYAWFIKRDPATGARTHHIHVIPMDDPAFRSHWDRLLFRDYLIEHPDVAADYERLKRRLAGESAADRVRYTDAKSAFIRTVTDRAKEQYATRGQRDTGRDAR